VAIADVFKVAGGVNSSAGGKAVAGIATPIAASARMARAAPMAHCERGCRDGGADTHLLTP
jgi:hypothetical protein